MACDLGTLTRIRGGSAAEPGTTPKQREDDPGTVTRGGYLIGCWSRTFKGLRVDLVSKRRSCQELPGTLAAGKRCLVPL
jgi:hypothetical protein